MSAEKNPHQVRREILQKLEDRPEGRIFRLGIELGRFLAENQRNRRAILRNIAAARALGVLIDVEDIAR